MRFRVLALRCIIAAAVSLHGFMSSSAEEVKALSTKHAEGSTFLEKGAWRRLWIVTGGQSGVDRAAMDVALELHLPLRGWCPKGRVAEDGPIAARYPLQETTSDDPALRTELNTIDSDGTLVLFIGKPTDGTPLTAEVAQLHKRPLLEINLATFSDSDIEKFRAWISQNSISVLNVAGPRESHSPGNVYRQSSIALKKLLIK